MKKVISCLILTCMLAAMLLAGCTDAPVSTDPSTTGAPSTAPATTAAPSTTSPHTHSAGEAWSVDQNSHWHICADCGEYVDEAAHTLDENGLCSVCGCGVWVYDDGTYEIFFYDDQGALCQWNCYEADGTLYYRVRYVFEYDDQGCVISQKDYVFDPAQGYTEDFLECERYYAYCEDSEYAETYLSEEIYYYADGTKCHSTYNEQGDLITAITYEADGTVSNVERCEKEYDENGGCIRELVYSNDVLTAEYCYIALPDGEYAMSKSVVYDEDGSVFWMITCEYEIVDGRTMSQTCYENGVLSWAVYYQYDEYGGCLILREVEYDADGNIISDIRYDENGEQIV